MVSGVTVGKTLRTLEPGTSKVLPKDEIEELLRRAGAEGTRRSSMIALLVERGVADSPEHIEVAIAHHRGVWHYGSAMRLDLARGDSAGALDTANALFGVYKDETKPVEEGRGAPSIKARQAVRRARLEEQMGQLAELLPLIGDREGVLKLYEGIKNYVRGQQSASPFEEDLMRDLALAIGRTQEQIREEERLREERRDAFAELHGHMSPNGSKPESGLTSGTESQG